MTASCGERTVGDEGEEYLCALYEGHQGDHVEGYGLCTWPREDPAFVARMVPIRSRCPRLATVLGLYHDLTCDPEFWLALEELEGLLAIAAAAGGGGVPLPSGVITGEDVVAGRAIPGERR